MLIRCQTKPVILTELSFFIIFAGIKFIVLADPRQTGIDALLRKIYEIYSDFALKNPFYSLEMPIRCVFLLLQPCILWALHAVQFDASIYQQGCGNAKQTNKKCLISFRCELFDQNLKNALEVAEKAGTFGPGSWTGLSLSVFVHLTRSPEVLQSDLSREMFGLLAFPSLPDFFFKLEWFKSV